MASVVISRHYSRRLPYGYLTLGDEIERSKWNMDRVPVVGELITVHPDPPDRTAFGGPSERSWTGRVTGVQHVVSRVRARYTDTQSLTVLTVQDEGSFQ